MSDWRSAWRADARWVSPEAPPPILPPHPWSGLLLATSGTGGQRRWALHPWDNLIGAAQRDVDDRPLLSFLSPTHAAGLEAAMQAELHRRPFHTVPFPWREADLSKAPFRPLVASLTPATLWRLLATAGGKALLSGLEEVRVGGEALPSPLARASAAAFPRLKLQTVFGTTETWAVATRHLGDGEVLFDDPVARASLEQGELRITTPFLATHLLDGEGQLTPVSSPYATGDRLEVGSAGGLRFLPREGRTGKVAGIKFLAPELEADLMDRLEVPWAQVQWLSCPLLGQRPKLLFPTGQTPTARALREWADHWRLPVAETTEAPFPQPDGRGKTR